MAGVTLEQAEAKLAEYMAAESAVLKGQAYTIFGSRQVTRADLAEIRAGRQEWDTIVRELTTGRGRRTIRVRGVTPI